MPDTKDPLKEAREKVLDTITKYFDNHEISYHIENNQKRDFIKDPPSVAPKQDLMIFVGNCPDIKLVCAELNNEIKDLGGLLKTQEPIATDVLYLSMNNSISEEVGPDETYVKHDLDVPELAMPGLEHEILSIQELLDQTDPKNIYVTSDWHWFRGSYKKQGRNPINDQELLKFCKEHIKEDDVLIYLGDICFRFASKEHIEQSMKYMAQIPGNKILVLGNHDTLLGQDFYTGCGFKYVVEEFEWKNFIFTHRPIDVKAKYSSTYWNIHGHIHDKVEYFTSDGKRNINVYPYFFKNGIPTMDYIMNHLEDLVKDHVWVDNGMYGESAFNGDFTNNKLAAMKYLNEASSNPDKPTVYFSDKIDSYTLAYMASLYASKVKGRVAIKMHCGEEGNENYLKPSLYKDLVKYTHANFVDSNVAYKSKRATTEGHKATAKLHGFDKVAYFDVLDEYGNMSISVPVQNAIKREMMKKEKEDTYLGPLSDGQHLSEVSVGSRLGNYDSMIVVTHFKGHPMAGYGGAVKNIGMGVPTGKVGKLQVHGKNMVREPIFLERLVESATAVENFFDGNIIYINVLKNLSVDCDCEAGAHKSTMKDIGIVVSDNLYAVEQASLDLVRLAPNNKDLMERISSRGGFHQLEYMEALGLKPANGYTLKDIDGTTLKLDEAAILLEETKRSELPDSAFGIPEDRKFPLDTPEHVRSAIKLFGHAEESKKKALAKRIKRAADKYGIEIPENTQVAKYLRGETKESSKKESTISSRLGGAIEKYAINSDTSNYLHEGGIEDTIPYGVDTIVFDLGNVMLGEDSHHVLTTSFAMSDHLAHVTADHIEDLLFNDDNTSRLKNATVDEAKKYFRDNSPRDIADHTDQIFDAIGDTVYKMPYADDLIKAFRYKGYRLYYLSNWTRFSYEVQKDIHESVTDQFDGGLYNFDCPYDKPDRRIYEELFNRFNLDPDKCFFFDDKAQNIIGAEAAGMRGMVFDPIETPRILLDDVIEIPSSAYNSVIIDTGVALETAQLEIDDWDHIVLKKDPEIYNADGIDGWNLVPRPHEAILDGDELDTDSDNYVCSIGDACHLSTNSELFNNQNVIEKIIYVHNKPDENGHFDKVPLGQIAIHPDRSYEWQLQYPVEYINGHFRSKLKEFSMAAVNPVVGLMRPFILKAGVDTGCTISPKQYALSPDIISDKYLVVNENAQLQVIDAKYFNDYTIDGIYEFVGDKNLINRINEAYKTGKYVDNTFFYTTLTGKPMLCEDQIDFDSNFKKIDIEGMVENVITNMATTKMQFMEANSFYGPAFVPVIESGLKTKIPFLDQYNKHGDLYVREDFDGYYYYCSSTKKRSRSVGSISMLTEAMIKSVL